MLDRVCPDCGFDASNCQAQAVADLIRENADVWDRLRAEGAIHPGRRDPATWSPLEYACHVRDVYRRYDDRIALMLAEHDPLFPNWDQNASAVEDRYDQQDPKRVVNELRTAAEAIAARLDRVSTREWDRPGRRSDGASFTLDSISEAVKG